MNIKNTPLPVKRTLKKLGQDRKRRRIPMRLAAERASISRVTLGKLKKGMKVFPSEPMQEFYLF